MTLNLPPFQASRGPAKARQLEAQRDRYRRAIDALRAEIARTEAAFAVAFERADARSGASERIKNLAYPSRQQKRLQ
ncbi:MAG: hypothetical protein ACOH19_03195 [Rhodoglobus sp.]